MYNLYIHLIRIISIYFTNPREFHVSANFPFPGSGISPRGKGIFAARTNGINDRNNIPRGRRKAHTFQSTCRGNTIHAYGSPRVHPIFPKTFSQHFRESFLSFPFLFLFFVIKVVGSSTNEDRYAVVNSVGRSN